MSIPPLIRKSILVSLCLPLALVSTKTWAQPLGGNNGSRANQENSPYSRYGIGNIRSPYNANARGMGGIGSALAPSMSVNSFNPASYSFLTAATLDIAFEARRRSVFLGNKSTHSGTGNFSYLSLGMNIGQHVGLNIGFKPIANTYYNAQDTVHTESMGVAERNFNGSGNLQMAFIGLSGQYKGISIGVNFGYTFGSYSYTNSFKTAGTDTSGKIKSIRSTQLTHHDHIGGIYWNAGILYHKTFKKDYFLNLGLTATLSQQLKVKRNIFDIGYNYLQSQQSNQRIVDTVANSQIKGVMNMPAKYSFGAAYGKGQKWKVAGDFSYTDWSGFDKLGKRIGVGDDAWRISLGGSYTPVTSSAGKGYLSYVTYRLGAYYGKDYFHIFNTDVHYFGGTIGLSLPLQRKYNNFGEVNLALNVSRRGTLTNGLAREVFVNFTFGISFNDTYWLKRPAKYD